MKCRMTHGGPDGDSSEKTGGKTGAKRRRKGRTA